MSPPRRARLLLPTLGALFLGLTVGSQTAHAAGSSRASAALQIGVEVVRSCTIDSMAARTSGAFDAAGREALVLATQNAIATSCGASQTRVRVLDVRVNLVEPSGTLPRLDVEF